MCNGPWKDHGAQYYECSKYKEDETVGDVQEQVEITSACHLQSTFNQPDKRLIQEFHYQNIFIIFNVGKIIVEV